MGEERDIRRGGVGYSKRCCEDERKRLRVRGGLGPKFMYSISQILEKAEEWRWFGLVWFGLIWLGFILLSVNVSCETRACGSTECASRRGGEQGMREGGADAWERIGMGMGMAVSLSLGFDHWD